MCLNLPWQPAIAYVTVCCPTLNFTDEINDEITIMKVVALTFNYLDYFYYVLIHNL